MAAVEASDLLRATLRAILAERGIDHGAADGIDALAAKAIPALGQGPDAVPDGARGAGHMRALLGLLVQAPVELAQIAPLYENGRGRLVSAKGRLVVWCRACRRTSRLDVVPVLVKLGPGERISDLGRYLTCEGCRNKGWADVRVEWF